MITNLPNLKNYYTIQKIKSRAAKQVKLDGVRAAAEAMFILNRHAITLPNGLEKRMIYQAKNIFVRWLYQNGYCLKVIPQQQAIYCRTCGGSGAWYTGDQCHQCCGTGIYRKHILYEFTFEVAGKYYVWHQPRSMVDWEVELTTYTTTAFAPRGGAERVSSDQTSAYYILLVNTFLLRNGINQSELPNFPGFRQCLVQDWDISSPIYARFRPIRKYWRRLKTASGLAWGYVRNGKIPGYQKIIEDEIHF